MIQISLEDHEKEVLVDVLKSVLSELREEAAHTDRLLLRQEIASRENIIHAVLLKLT